MLSASLSIFKPKLKHSQHNSSFSLPFMVRLAQRALKQIAPRETHWDSAGGRCWPVSGQATYKTVSLQHILPSADASKSSLSPQGEGTLWKLASAFRTCR